jgi:uncharacterized membrane protein
MGIAGWIGYVIFFVGAFLNLSASQASFERDRNRTLRLAGWAFACVVIGLLMGMWETKIPWWAIVVVTLFIGGLTFYNIMTLLGQPGTRRRDTDLVVTARLALPGGLIIAMIVYLICR